MVSFDRFFEDANFEEKKNDFTAIKIKQVMSLKSCLDLYGQDGRSYEMSAGKSLAIVGY